VRRRLPPELEERFSAFRAVVASVERGTRAITQSVPSTRYAGRPLPDTLAEFEEALREAREGMEGWRAPQLKAEWTAADAALEEALAIAEGIRLRAPEPAGFEGLIGLIGDLLAPLEAFERAAAVFHAQRT